MSGREGDDTGARCACSGHAGRCILERQANRRLGRRATRRIVTAKRAVSRFALRTSKVAAYDRAKEEIVELIRQTMQAEQRWRFASASTSSVGIEAGSVKDRPESLST